VKKLGYLLPVALLVLATAARLHAQIDGCDDSPENPTVVLGVIVSAASIGFVQLKNRIAARRNAKQK
jgi:XrtJ-associated TM-motif-TM protein